MIQESGELLLADAGSGMRTGPLSRLRTAGWFAARLTAYFAVSFAATAGVFLLAHI